MPAVKRALMLTSALVAIGAIPHRPVHAQSAAAPTAQSRLNIPAQPLSRALVQYSNATGVQLFFNSDLVRGKKAPSLRGDLTTAQAMNRLLAGSGLTYRISGNAVTIVDPNAGGNNLGASVDGAIALDTIDVSGGGFGARPDDLPYQTAAPTSYISLENIERFRGTSPADIFRGTPGVMSGEARNGNAVDINVRGMQGMGRVPVTVDGTISATTTYQGYQGASNRTYIDPDLIGGISIEKGPGTGAYGGIAGAVSMDTISASDILASGQNVGLRIKGGVGTNSSGVPALNTVGGMFFPGSRPGSVIGPEHVDRPALLEPTRQFGSAAAAMRTEGFEFVGAYAVRRNGNYHAGRNGPSAKSTGDLGPRTICKDYGDGRPFCTNYTQYYENSGLSEYRGGEEVFNTSSNTDSWLIKAKFTPAAGQTLELIHSGFRSDHGDIRASLLSSPMGQQATQRWTSTAAVDRYAIRHRWNPADNDLIDLRSNIWLSDFELRNPTTAGSGAVIALGLPNPLRKRVLVGTDTRQWGADITNTSLLTSRYGEVSISYGLSYLNEDTRPTDLTRVLEEFLPANGTRDEWQAFTNASWKPFTWLTVDGGLRYQTFSTRDRAIVGDTPAAGFVAPGLETNGSGVSPTIGVAVTPFTGTQLYARYSEGLRMPSVTESSAFGATHVPPGVRPERSHNWDVGVNFMTKNILSARDDLKVKLGWFHNTVDDYIARRIVNIQTSHGTSYAGPGVGNIHQALFEGFELSGRYTTGDLSIELGATYYTDMAYCITSDTCQRSSLYGDYATNHVPPEYTASLTVTHKFFDDALTLGGRATYIGPRAIAADQPTVQGAAPLISPIEWKPYTLVDVFAEYKLSENLKAELRVENVGDIYYVDPLGLANIPGPGRTIWASLTAKF